MEAVVEKKAYEVMNRRELARGGVIGLLGVLFGGCKKEPEQMAEYDLGTLFHEADGSVYKYGAVDFGPLGTDSAGEELRHIQYSWFPWNVRACHKALISQVPYGVGPVEINNGKTNQT